MREVVVLSVASDAGAVEVAVAPRSEVSEEEDGGGASTLRHPPPEYRQWLVAAEQKCQDDFDKTVLYLSGGALGVSFVLVKDVIGVGAIDHPALLLAAWMSWAFSALCVLCSFFASHLALRRAIAQCDEGTIYAQTPGGKLTALTRHLNAGGALLFFAGVCFMAAFTYSNLVERDVNHVRKEAAEQPAAPTAVASPAPTGTPKR